MQPLKLLSAWNHDLARAIGALGGDDFFAMTVRALRQRVMFVYPQVWLYHRDLPPRILYHDIPEDAQAAQIDRYLEGPYREDPLFLASMNRPKNRFYSLSRMTSGRLENSSYYKSYYAETGTIDEAIYLARLPGGNAVNLSMMRLPEHGAFSEAEYQLMYSLADPIAEMMQVHCSHDAFAKHNLIQPDIDHQINVAFQTFGSALLTPREKSVLELMLRGYGTDTTAERLGIAVETVRRHRKSIYRKLDVNSQTDLFSLFLNSMSCITEAGGKDPLMIYMGLSEGGAVT